MEGQRGTVPLARSGILVAPEGRSLDLLSDPVPARGARRAWLTSRTAGTVGVRIEEARDGRFWSEVSALDLSASPVGVASSPIGGEWLRLRVTLGPGARASLSLDGEVEGSGGGRALGGTESTP